MKRKVIVCILCVIALLTAVLAGYYIKYGSGKNGTVTAVVKTFEKSDETEGYIVKNERVINLDGGNFARYYFKNGEKVAAGSKIVSLYNNEEDGALIAEIEKIDERIKNLDGEYVNLTANDVIKVENYIDEDIDRLEKTYLKGDAASAALIKDRLVALFNIKHSNQAPAEDDKKALEQEKTALETKLSSAKNDILSPTAGIFSDKTDGFENILTFDNILNITREKFDEILKEKGTENSRACKIIDNYKWYIVCKVKSAVLSDKNTGDTVSVIMSDGETLNGKIEHIVPCEGAESIVVLSSDREYSGLSDVRKTEIKIVFDSYTGFVLPTKAFHFYDGEYGVFVKQNSRTVFKKTEVIYSDDEYTVVSKGGKTELKLYDTVITDGDLDEYYD